MEINGNNFKKFSFYAKSAHLSVSLARSLARLFARSLSFSVRASFDTHDASTLQQFSFY